MDDNQSPNPYETPATHDPQADVAAPRPTGSTPRKANFDTVIDVIKELWRDHAPTLLSAWGSYSAVWLLISLITTVGSLALGVDPASQQEALENISSGRAGPTAILDLFGPQFWAFMGLTVLLGFVQMGVGVATFGPVRRAWKEGRSLSIMEVVGQIGTGIGRGALFYLVFTIAFTVGIVLCILPGLAVGYFMLPAFYLVGRGDGIFDSLSTGFEWAKRHVALLAVLIAASIGLVFVFACLGGVGSQIFMATGKVGHIISQIFTWFFGSVIGFGVWVLYTGTMLTIEQDEEQSMDW